MVLDCTKNGDKRFHPDVARVTIFNETDTINGHYNKAKRTKTGEVAVTHDEVAYFFVQGVKVPVEFAEQFYICLWLQCILTNEFIKGELKKYSDFMDGKEEQCVNSQAKVFRLYRDGGTGALRGACSEFLAYLKQPSRTEFVKEETVKEVENKIALPPFDEMYAFGFRYAKSVVENGGEKNFSNMKETLGKSYPFSVKDVMLDQKLQGIVEALTILGYDYYMKNVTENYGNRRIQDLKNKYKALISEVNGKE